jgi:AAA domain-containing protein
MLLQEERLVRLFCCRHEMMISHDEPRACIPPKERIVVAGRPNSFSFFAHGVHHARFRGMQDQHIAEFRGHGSGHQHGSMWSSSPRSMTRRSVTRLTKAGRHELIQTLQAFLTSLATIQAHAVVIIDEAQHLQPDVLEQIRLLSNKGRPPNHAAYRGGRLYQHPTNKVLNVEREGKEARMACCAGGRRGKGDRGVARRMTQNP